MQLISKRATQIKSNQDKGQINSTQISNSKNGLKNHDPSLLVVRIHQTAGELGQGGEKSKDTALMFINVNLTAALNAKYM
mgnify:CR=1 FL=1